MNEMKTTKYNRENGVSVNPENKIALLDRLEGYKFFEGYAQDGTLTPIPVERTLFALDACGFVDIDHVARTANIWIF